MKTKKLPVSRRPVYLVVGIMTGKDIAAKKESNAEVSLSGHVKLIADTGVDAEATWATLDSVKIEDEIIFAYQLVKLEVEGFDKVIKTTDFHHPSARVIEV